MLMGHSGLPLGSGVAPASSCFEEQTADVLEEQTVGALSWMTRRLP
jgi:hypothetical protein